MALRNCARCGRLMDGRLGNLCPECHREDSKAFEAVVAYLREHPEANLMEVSRGTGVDADRIRRFLREGRLELAGDPHVLHCDRCGASIAQGRLCSDCIQELAQQAASQPSPAPGPATRESPARLHLGEQWLRERRERFRR